MRRALVTGSAGFLGRHFVAELTERGYTVDGWDIAAGRDALSLFADGYWPRPDLLIHCAAREPFREAIDTKPELMCENLLLDAAMWRWVMRGSARELSRTRVLYLSSSAAYPMRYQDGTNPVPLVESLIDSDHIDSSDADYGWVKITGEHMAANARAMGVRVSVARPFTGYGSDQSADHPFAAFLGRAMNRDDPYVIWGDGQQLRDWIHVDDVINACLAIVDDEVAEPVNVCTGVATSMLELTAMMCAQVGYRPSFELRMDMPRGVPFRVGDPSLLHRHYTPKVDLAEGVRRAVG